MTIPVFPKDDGTDPSIYESQQAWAIVGNLLTQKRNGWGGLGSRPIAILDDGNTTGLAPVGVGTDEVQELDYSGAIISGARAAINDPISDTSVTISGDWCMTMQPLNAASAITVTLPNNLPKGFACAIRQSSTGRATFVPATNATLSHPLGHTKTMGQNAVVGLMVISNLTGNTAAWDLVGYTAA